MASVLSCSKKPPFAEIKDKDLIVQASVKVLTDQDTIGPEYKIRIFPVFKGSNDEKKVREKLQYNVDSCFYMMKNAGKLYPDAVIPVANGIKDCYEYLVIFPKTAYTEPEISKLIYKDKYINSKTYQLTLK